MRFIRCFSEIGFFLILIIFSATVSDCFGATYYIDYQTGLDSNNGVSTIAPWQRAPGMAGFAGSYSHSAGDIFVFKGGVTWPASVFPMRIQNSGSGVSCDLNSATSTCDQYVGGQQCGSFGSPSCNGGAAWGTGYPVFDGEASANFQSGLLVSSQKSYFIINGLKIIRTGDTSTGSGQALLLDGGSSKEVKNCWIEPNAVNHFADSCTGGGSKTYFHGNTLKKGGRVVVSCEDNIYDDYQFYDNIFYGGGDYDSHNYHTDGFMIQSDASGSAKFTNVRVYRNKFLGDWSKGGTALIYSSSNSGKYGIKHFYIYNNQFAYDNNTGGDSLTQFIRLVGESSGAVGIADVKIYNNTFDGQASVARPGQCIATYYKVTDIDIQNNIFSGCGSGVLLDTGIGGTITIEHNLYYAIGQWYIDQSGTSRYCNADMSNCRNVGLESLTPQGQYADPKFVASPSGGVIGSGNWHLQSKSPAYNAGANLSIYFTTDIEGQPRPNSAWTLGAYEGSTGIFGPTNLKVISK
jgi:hypothetical protein